MHRSGERAMRGGGDSDPGRSSLLRAGGARGPIGQPVDRDGKAEMKLYAYVFTALCLITSSPLVGDDRSLGEADDDRQSGTIVGTREPQDSVGQEVFRRQCTVCHGNEGKGDGRAAVAFNPPPSDLTDAVRLGRLSGAELLAVIGTGRASMPGFATVLSPEELRAVTGYVRSLPNENGLK